MKEFHSLHVEPDKRGILCVLHENSFNEIT